MIDKDFGLIVRHYQDNRGVNWDSIHSIDYCRRCSNEVACSRWIREWELHRGKLRELLC